MDVVNRTLSCIRRNLEVKYIYFFTNVMFPKILTISEEIGGEIIFFTNVIFPIFFKVTTSGKF